MYIGIQSNVTYDVDIVQNISEKTTYLQYKKSIYKIIIIVIITVTLIKIEIRFKKVSTVGPTISPPEVLKSQKSE